ncbi:MAG: acetyl/propionyl/methylcrotonyl-CoA carboxylase subunit alpha [Herbaspirillum sp.]
MFKKILIANRGEIACRVAATARRMGIQTVAVYSDADIHAKHVAVCDEAIHIGPAAAKESYLVAERIIQAAKASGAEAIHPGYGFLSENAEFAQACIDAGLVFIGPPASAIHAMGSKSAAKTLMQQAAVPLVPGYHGDDQDASLLNAEADRIGYPVLLKPSAGGGGKGMRVVENSAEFKEALASCKREAISSFGDDKVLVEKYLLRPRHIEIQIFGDMLGNYVYLFERDCSVQRRHQKVLEEAPAPGMTSERRRAMGEAAIAAARAVGYVGAGTVEFIAADSHGPDAGKFYFMEMNTRLQVEHPVTEMITGTDLVEWQLRVAAGQALPLRQEQLQIHGHALEARIYAENPEKGFLPSIGTLTYLRTPTAVEFTTVASDGAQSKQSKLVRIDSGVREGDVISPFYDPMIAKLIVWGVDRDAALAHMVQALSDYQIVGLSSNIAFLKRLILGQPFATADLDTGLIERHHDALFPPVPVAPLSLLALAVAALLQDESRVGAANNQNDPWSDHSGWRLNSRLQRTLEFADEQHVYQLKLEYQTQGWLLSREQESVSVLLEQHSGDDFTVRLAQDNALSGTVRRVINPVTIEEDTFHVFANGQHLVLRYRDPMLQAGAGEADGGRLTAPMPGKIIALLVAAGDKIEKGAPLLIMEAMKMEHTITAPSDGVVEELLYAVGDQVTEGAQLLAFKAA